VVHRGVIAIMFAAAFMLGISIDLDAQTRIRFRPGATSADVSGTLNGHDSRRTYLIRVREGQTFRAAQISSTRRWITISIKGMDGEYIGGADASCNNRHEISPTTAGDYTIEVVECPKADPWRGRFTFRVTIR
jgi:hypothetical protein